jgi:hypothetical protein
LPSLLKYEQEYKCDFSKIPENSELIHWKNLTFLEHSIKVASYVIKGFGRGGKQLGMPTGTINNKKINYNSEKKYLQEIKRKRNLFYFLFFFFFSEFGYY